MARVERIVSQNGRRKKVFAGEIFRDWGGLDTHTPHAQGEQSGKLARVFPEQQPYEIPRFGNCGNTEGMFWRALRACGEETKKDLVCYKRGRGHDVRRKRIRNTARRRAARMKKEYLLRQEEERETIEELIA